MTNDANPFMVTGIAVFAICLVLSLVERVVPIPPRWRSKPIAQFVSHTLAGFPLYVAIGLGFQAISYHLRGELTDQLQKMEIAGVIVANASLGLVLLFFRIQRERKRQEVLASTNKPPSTPPESCR